MKVLVYPHDLNMGGSQTNAIEIAAKIRDLGVESVVFGRPGVLSGRIRELGLDFIESPDPGRRPSVRIARLLRTLADEQGIDVLHGYEWPPSLECAAAALGSRRTVAVSTVMSMAVAPFIPRTMPLIVGTEQIADAERSSGRSSVSVLEPPVDLSHNVAPPAAELDAFRRRWHLRPGATVLVAVTRLAAEMKAEGLLSAISALGDQLRDLDLQLLIVGDGPAREQIRAAADATNATTDPYRVVLTGELLDPRAAYAVADIVLGMGGSALRALAFEKPLIVQGEQGFFELLDSDTWPRFAWQGWYGVGTGAPDGPRRFADIVRPLMATRWPQTAAFGRRLVEDRFSLEAAARRQYDSYVAALEHPAPIPTSAIDAARSGARFTGHYARRRLDRLRGRRATDDFNSRPVAATAVRRPVTGLNRADGGALVYLAGAPWHAVSGTDVHLARAVSAHRPVIWVDPPVSIVSRLRRGIDVPAISTVEPGITRIHTTALPGVTRPGIRTFSRWQTLALTRGYLRSTGRHVAAVIASAPEPTLSSWRSLGARRIYFATDDFVEGAELLGLSQSHATEALQSNLSAADTVLAVTSTLADRLRERTVTPTLVFPNGCDIDRYADVDSLERSSVITLRGPVAGVIGQLNERLDLDLLEAAAARGVSLLLVGPRYERDPAFRERLSALIDRPNVQWVGRRPADELPGLLAGIDLGLTPYAVTAFNEASFPLKTLEYLAAGRRVVSSRLPANDLLDPALVHSADSAAEFAGRIEKWLAEPRTAHVVDLCRSQATVFSWQNRAEALEAIVAGTRRRRSVAPDAAEPPTRAVA